VRYTYPNPKKRQNRGGGDCFRRRGFVPADSNPACDLGEAWKPTRGERHTQKTFGAVHLDNASFIYLHQEDYFQWETYLVFLEQVVVPAFYRRRHRIYLIQDNASYQKKQETYDWFKTNRRYVEVFQLPPYWPELNATERIWNYTRKYVTHNRFFERPQGSLRRALRQI
jgi:hypothetical protein